MPVAEVAAHHPPGWFPAHLANQGDTGDFLPPARHPVHYLLEGNSPEDGLGDAEHWKWIRRVPKGRMLRLGFPVKQYLEMTGPVDL